MEMIWPSSLMERDWPVVPKGIVSATTVVERIARHVKIEVKKTMFDIEVGTKCKIFEKSVYTKYPQEPA
jgi:hypothetical protein